jgi:hypothetical protein
MGQVDCTAIQYNGKQYNGNVHSAVRCNPLLQACCAAVAPYNNLYELHQGYHTGTNFGSPKGSSSLMCTHPMLCRLSVDCRFKGLTDQVTLPRSADADTSQIYFVMVCVRKSCSLTANPTSDGSSACAWTTTAPQLLGKIHRRPVKQIGACLRYILQVGGLQG